MLSRTPERPERPEPPGEPEPATATVASARSTWWPAIGFGLLAGVLTGFALVGLVAAPLFLWAKATEPGLGLQRPLVRDGLRAAPLLGLAAFALTTVVATRWRLREQRRQAGQNDDHG